MRQRLFLHSLLKMYTHYDLKIILVGCLNYFAIVVIRHHDQEIQKIEFWGGLQFQRVSIHNHHGGQHGCSWRPSEDETGGLDLEERDGMDKELQLAYLLSW